MNFLNTPGNDEGSFVPPLSIKVFDEVIQECGLKYEAEIFTKPFNTGQCEIYTSLHTVSHTFYIDPFHYNPKNGMTEQDFRYIYWLPIKKAQLAERYTPLLSTNHTNLEPYQIGHKQAQFLAEIENLRNIWAMDFLLNENPDIWDIYVQNYRDMCSQLKNLEPNFSNITYRDKMLNVLTIMASAARNDEKFSLMELCVILREIHPIRNDHISQNLEYILELFINLPSLQENNNYGNMKVFEKAANELSDYMRKNAPHIKIKFEDQLIPSRNPSNYVMYLE